MNNRGQLHLLYIMFHFVINQEDLLILWFRGKNLVFLRASIRLRFDLTYLWWWFWQVLSLPDRTIFPCSVLRLVASVCLLLFFFMALIWSTLYFYAFSFWKISGQLFLKVLIVFILFLTCVVEGVWEKSKWFLFGLLGAADDRIICIDCLEVLEKYLDFSSWLLYWYVILQPFLLLLLLVALIFNRWQRLIFRLFNMDCSSWRSVG